MEADAFGLGNREALPVGDGFIGGDVDVHVAAGSINRDIAGNDFGALRKGVGIIIGKENKTNQGNQGYQTAGAAFKKDSFLFSCH